MKKIYGLMATVILSFAAYFLGQHFPLIGGPVFGITLGILVGNLFTLPSSWQPGITFSSKRLLQLGIILIGAGFNLLQILRVGSDSIIIILACLLTALISAYILGKILGVQDNIARLIGIGTAICGGTAIVALSPILKAKEDEISYAISTIFFYNVLAVLLFPVLGHLLQMGSETFGLFAGTAINDTSSVVAAGYAYGSQAGDYATIVKLTRTLMLIPVSLGYALYMAKQNRTQPIETGSKLHKVFPLFILWFLVMAFFSTAQILPSVLVLLLPKIGKFFIIIALSAIGLKTNLKMIVKTGFRPLLLGLLVWLLVILMSLSVIRFLG